MQPQRFGHAALPAYGPEPTEAAQICCGAPTLAIDTGWVSHAAVESSLREQLKDQVVPDQLLRRLPPTLQLPHLSGNGSFCTSGSVRCRRIACSRALRRLRRSPRGSSQARPMPAAQRACRAGSLAGTCGAGPRSSWRVAGEELPARPAEQQHGANALCSIRMYLIS
jgi:hypothetical protein